MDSKHDFEPEELLQPVVQRKRKRTGKACASCVGDLACAAISPTKY